MKENIIREIRWDETDKGYSIYYREQLYMKVLTYRDLADAIHNLVDDELERLSDELES